MHLRSSPPQSIAGAPRHPRLENESKREKRSKRVQQILKSTNKVKSTLKLIICRCCFYLTHTFEVARSEVLVFRFLWAFFFKTSIFACDGGLEGRKTILIKIKIGVTEIQQIHVTICPIIGRFYARDV